MVLRSVKIDHTYPWDPRLPFGRHPLAGGGMSPITISPFSKIKFKTRPFVDAGGVACHLRQCSHFSEYKRFEIRPFVDAGEEVVTDG